MRGGSCTPKRRAEGSAGPRFREWRIDRSPLTRMILTDEEAVDALAALRLDRLGIEQPDDAVGIAHRGYFGIGHDDGGIGIAHRQRGAALDPGRTVADDPVEFLPQLVDDFGDAVFGQRVL